MKSRKYIILIWILGSFCVIPFAFGQDPKFKIREGDSYAFSSRAEYKEVLDDTQNWLIEDYTIFRIDTIEATRIFYTQGSGSDVSTITPNVTGFIDYFEGQYEDNLGHIFIPSNIKMNDYLEDGKDDLIDTWLGYTYNSTTFPYDPEDVTAFAFGDYEFNITYNVEISTGNITGHYHAKYDTQGIRYYRSFFLYHYHLGGDDYLLNRTIKYLPDESPLEIKYPSDSNSIAGFSFSILLFGALTTIGFVVKRKK